MVILTLLDAQTRAIVKTWRFQQATIKVGRAPDNHIVVSNILVSRYHLELRTVHPDQLRGRKADHSGWEIVNHSGNGTFLNGYLINRAVLPTKGELRLAQSGPFLQFEIQSEPSPVSAEQVQAPKKSPQLPVISRPIELSQIVCQHSGNHPDQLFCIHCGQPLKVEKTIRQYQFIRPLARGGMGTTYLVWRSTNTATGLTPQRGDLLVLKEMNADVAHIPKAQELFEREATVLRNLQHPGIPRFYDFFVEGNKKYLVMELIHGLDLEQKVRQSGAVPLAQAIAWMIQTCDVLSYLHSRPTPIIHRDIKPSNLLVQHRDQRIVVLDFGAVKAVGLPPDTRIGAEGYSAPEQAQGRPVIQSDLYAVGTTLLFILTGLSPSRFYQKQASGYRLCLEEVTRIPLRVRQVIERVTDPHPGDRPASATELAHALAACL